MCVELAKSEVVVLTSDSESEIFCDSVEQLDNIKVRNLKLGSLVTMAHAELTSLPSAFICKQPVAGPSSEQSRHAFAGIQGQDYTPVPQVTQMGAGQGGEGTGDGHGPPMRRRDPGREGIRHGWREPPGKLQFQKKVKVKKNESF